MGLAHGGALPAYFWEWGLTLPCLPGSAITWTVQLNPSQIQDRSCALDKYNLFSLIQCQNCPAFCSALFQVCLQSCHFQHPVDPAVSGALLCVFRLTLN